MFWNHTFNFGTTATSVSLGRQILADTGRLCREAHHFRRALVVTDENVANLYAEPVRDALNRAGIDADLAVVPPGDASKSLQIAERLYHRLADWRVPRDGLVLAVGGGMVSDLAGFVGATWLRGVATVLCPTTLEADVDAGIGGKTALNHTSGKNLIGVFHQPRLVIIDTDCLASLHQRDLVAGMAESIKHAVITGEPFIAWHEENAADLLARNDRSLATLIERNVSIKAEFVIRDERDTSGHRAMLNFGHTIGHAIESAAGYQYPHGECVALGMVAACRLSESLGLIGHDVTERIVGLLETFKLPTRLHETIPEETLWTLLAHDKKIDQGALRFVLLRGIGQPFLRTDVPESAIREAIAALQPPTHT